MRERVLHVIDTRESGECAVEACAALVRRDESASMMIIGHEVGSLASRGVVERAPAGITELTWRRVRRRIREAGCSRVSPWGEGARRASVLGARGLATVGTVFAGWGRLGAGPADAPSRDEVRSRLGVPADRPLVALLGDPPGLADARRFVYLVGVLDIAETTVAGVMNHRSRGLMRARRFHSEAGVRWSMLVVRDRVSEVLPGADLAAVVPPIPCPGMSTSARESMRWLVLRSHALGVPVVAGRAWLPGEACPAGIEADLAAGDGELVELASRLTALTHDRDKRAEVADAVRRRVTEGAAS